MASWQQRQAFGWGPKITALRVLMAMMHLNSTVEVGFVIGRHREDQPDGFCHLHQAAFRKLADGADGTFVSDIVVDKFRGHHVLDGLVFKHAEPGFLNRQAGEILGLVQSGQYHRFDDCIDVLLARIA